MCQWEWPDVNYDFKTAIINNVQKTKENHKEVKKKKKRYDDNVTSNILYQKRDRNDKKKEPNQNSEVEI